MTKIPCQQLHDKLIPGSPSVPNRHYLTADHANLNSACRLKPDINPFRETPSLDNIEASEYPFSTQNQEYIYNFIYLAQLMDSTLLHLLQNYFAIIHKM